MRKLLSLFRKREPQWKRNLSKTPEQRVAEAKLGWERRRAREAAKKAGEL